MPCGCKISGYLGTCGCQSNFEGMKNHLTDRQIRNIKNKFDDNLFETAFYADEDAFSELFGRKKSKKSTQQTTDTNHPRKKIDFGNLLQKGKDLVNKANDILQGNQGISGDYNGIKYDASIDSGGGSQDGSGGDGGSGGDAGNGGGDNKQSKGILGIPTPVFITLSVVVAIIIVFVIVKMTSSNTASA